MEWATRAIENRPNSRIDRGISAATAALIISGHRATFLRLWSLTGGALSDGLTYIRTMQNHHSEDDPPMEGTEDAWNVWARGIPTIRTANNEQTANEESNRMTCAICQEDLHDDLQDIAG